MIHLPKTQLSPMAPGVAGLLLGFMGLALFFMPVLAIPVSACGLVVSLAGIFAVLWSRSVSLRWSTAGVALCATALAISVALALAPSNYWPGRGSPRPWQPVPDRPYVPPPALPL